MKGIRLTHLFKCYDPHQFTNAGYIGMTETQQREKCVCLNNREKERCIYTLKSVRYTIHNDRY